MRTRITAPMVAPLAEGNPMENQVPTIEEAVEEVLCGCVSCISVPLSILELELDQPLGGWDGLLEQLRIRVTVDAIGRRSISTVSARRLLSMRRHQVEKAAEDHVRRTEEFARKHPVKAGGLPFPTNGDPSLTAHEVMLAHDADQPDPNKRMSPTEEFLLSELGPPRKVEGRRERR